MTYHAVGYRAAAFETPLWGFPNVSAGRWNRAGSWPAQYLSLHPMTPWAELLRNLDLRTPDEARRMRVPIWAIRVELADDPLPIDFEDAADHGLGPEDLVADDRTACQALAAALRDRGVGSVLVPSAALPGTQNLVVLEPAVVIDYHQAPIDRDDYPTSMLAQDGRCPEGLWTKVHYIGVGTIHPALQAYVDGEVFRFDQPQVTPVTLTAV